jgi:release factor glutamine methyltransferase
VTIHELVAEARLRLRAAGVQAAEADFDARILAQHLLGWDAAVFFTRWHEAAEDDFIPLYRRLVERRAAREPVAYITGRQEFWGLAFEVSPDTLIPRPETELVVEAALEWLADRSSTAAVADVGTGSGCLAVSIAVERGSTHIVASDISRPALEVAARNAARHGVGDRVTFVQSDLFEHLEGPFDLIVANPPYIPDVDRRALQPEVGRHEPEVALFGGADGMALISRLVHGAPSRLKPSGGLIFEFGFGQADAVDRLISRSPGLRMVDIRRDLQGIARTAVLARSS